LIVYALVLSDLSCAVDLFLGRGEAEVALGAMLRDEPEWESLASVEELDFSAQLSIDDRRANAASGKVRYEWRLP
jgi:hypothetical protein